MNLKEAFRYQNFLDGTISKAISVLRQPQNTVRVAQEHKRSAAAADAEDGTIDATAERPFSATVDQMVTILDMLVSEKHACSIAIAEAKADYYSEHGFCLDAEITTNRHRQAVASVFKLLGGMKEVTRTVRGTGYRFNAEGNQVSYVYDVEEKIVPDFGANRVRELGKVLADEADRFSSDADLCMVSAPVNFAPRFNANDAFEDVIETACKLLSA